MADRAVVTAKDISKLCDTVHARDIEIARLNELLAQRSAIDQSVLGQHDALCDLLAGKDREISRLADLLSCVRQEVTGLHENKRLLLKDLREETELLDWWERNPTRLKRCAGRWREDAGMMLDLGGDLRDAIRKAMKEKRG